MEQSKERKTLKYLFSDREKLILAGELANKQQELRQLEDQKKSINSEYASRINIAREHININADKLASGYEMREIDCKVQYHTPEQNKKLLLRLDTMEEWIEPMTDYDYNLFTQFQEEHAVFESDMLELEVAETY